MVLKLQPSQISAMWDAIKFAALGANNIGDGNIQSFLNNLLSKLLAGSAQVWVFHEDTEEGRYFNALVITCVMQEPIFEYNYLLVHSLYGFRKLNLEVFNEGLQAFEQFARENQCRKIVGMTTDTRILKLHQHLGMIQEVFVSSKTV